MEVIQRYLVSFLVSNLFSFVLISSMEEAEFTKKERIVISIVIGIVTSLVMITLYYLVGGK